MPAGQIFDDINWSKYYPMILKRLFQDNNQGLLQRNRDAYAKSTEKTIRPCDKCGSNNKFIACESCAFASFVTSTKKEDIEAYIQRNLTELTQRIQTKAIRESFKKKLNSKISDLKGKPIKEAEPTEDETSTRPRENRKRNASVIEEENNNTESAKRKRI